MYQLTKEEGSRFIEMTENYRSECHLVDFSNDFLHNVSRRMKVTPIKSMKENDGRVEVVHCNSLYMYKPLVDCLMSHKGKGSSCILTQTNEETVTLVAILRRNGIRCKLIQSMEGLLFWNMVEVRYFMKYISKHVASPLILDDLWENAKHKTFSLYERSKSLAYLKRCIELFEQTSKTKYLSDFKEFVFESSVEDFCDISGADVVVSTIHKAKGREFDDVYMLISGNYAKDDCLMRRYYVGMTRAKQRLFIYTNGNCFDNLRADMYITDREQYDMPEEIVLQLSHKDVYLEFFKGRKNDVLALRSGDTLTYDKYLLYNKVGKPVAKLSLNMQKKLAEWESRGYAVKSVSVRFIVAWKPKDAPKDETETAVLLADMVLSL